MSHLSSRAEHRERVRRHVERVWPERVDTDLADRLIAAIGGDNAFGDAPESMWDERDVVLITYGDSILGAEPPLRSLARFVDEYLAGSFGVLHVLPFAPSSSDRGFSPIDHVAVDPALGSWEDVERLGRRCDLMVDLVANHASSESAWFRQFRADREPGRNYFVTVDEDDDLTRVVRPRSLPLVTPVATSAGTRHVWTTFSADQIDLDWANPDLVCEMLRAIDTYVAHGARFLRLDAIAYLWKRSGTTCIHLPETHEMIRLIRTLLRGRAPHVVLVTETNVPDDENRSYLASGDEAHAVYNFTLPPLLLDAAINGSAERLAGWLASRPPLPDGTTVLNFVASHDGFGLRPAEGLLTPTEIEDLVERAHEAGGTHSSYSREGFDAPYELNVSLPDLLGDDDASTVSRVVAVHSVLLALAGIPLVYVNSLLGTTNDHAALGSTGVRREINRRSVRLSELAERDPAAPPSRIFDGIRRLAAVRRRCRALHPDAPQAVSGSGSVLRIDRSPSTGPGVVSLTNFADAPQTISIGRGYTDLLTAERCPDPMVLEPYGHRWLIEHDEQAGNSPERTITDARSLQ